MVMKGNVKKSGQNLKFNKFLILIIVLPLFVGFVSNIIFSNLLVGWRISKFIGDIISNFLIGIFT